MGPAELPGLQGRLEAKQRDDLFDSTGAGGGNAASAPPSRTRAARDIVALGPDPVRQRDLQSLAPVGRAPALVGRGDDLHVATIRTIHEREGKAIEIYVSHIVRTRGPAIREGRYELYARSYLCHEDPTEARRLVAVEARRGGQLLAGARMEPKSAHSLTISSNSARTSSPEMA